MSDMRAVEQAERERPRTAGSRPGPPVGPRDPQNSALSVAPREQLIYAKVLAGGMYLGLALLLVTFALYLTGVVAPAVPIDRLPELWSMDVTRYLEAVNARFLHRDHLLVGWSWVGVLRHGDYLNYVGIVVLSLVTLVCFLRIIPTLLRSRDYAYVAIAVLEVLILALAASGMLVHAG